MILKIEKLGHVVTKAHTKLLVLKQECQKLKQEVAAPDATNTAGRMVLPQPDESTKDEPGDLVAQEHALPSSSHTLGTQLRGANPTLLVTRTRQVKRTDVPGRRGRHGPHREAARGA